MPETEAEKEVENLKCWIQQIGRLLFEPRSDKGHYVTIKIPAWAYRELCEIIRKHS